MRTPSFQRLSHSLRHVKSLATTRTASSAAAPSPTTAATRVPTRVPPIGLSPAAAAAAPTSPTPGRGRSVHLQVYGCQQNVADADVVRAILRSAGFHVHAPTTAPLPHDADVYLANTCAIRDGAERKVLNRLREVRAAAASAGRRRTNKKKLVVGVLGCMAERMKTGLLEGPRPVADVVCGPDAYRDLPRLLGAVLDAEGGARATAYNVQLSLEETYADVAPVRRDAAGVSAFVSVMRGCDNVCTYCVVPFTRGRERSRPAASVREEVRRLVEEEGVREVVLLGQNVNSYNDASEGVAGGRGVVPVVDGFETVYRAKAAGGVLFADLLGALAEAHPEVRFRFTSPHPKDFPAHLVDTIAAFPNIPNQVHVPLQSGSTRVLAAMRRGYTQDAYLALIDGLRARLRPLYLSTDIIVGFPGETEHDFADTLDVMRRVQFDQAFMFAYSERPRTHAARHLCDDVPREVKLRRLGEVNELHYGGVKERGVARDVGAVQCVLVEGEPEGGGGGWTGRNEGNQRVFMEGEGGGKGRYVAVRVRSTNGVTLRGDILGETSTAEFERSEWGGRRGVAVGGMV